MNACFCQKALFRYLPAHYGGGRDGALDHVFPIGCGYFSICLSAWRLQSALSLFLFQPSSEREPVFRIRHGGRFLPPFPSLRVPEYRPTFTGR